ncbi:hypothetical protein OE88DRAFT_1809056 [Heliocybe sulcata]|uniref:Uncharacterized protein n=1 Tax=Heliocybe sulcata TaxID=5364 RepID=A0A5C3MXU7_9AGAM|nr:hypothetical protein OE88DRAFT_1809056 [Heliocybe sulcata]
MRPVHIELPDHAAPGVHEVANDRANPELELRWAVPLPSEYAIAKTQNIAMANAKESPLDADWVLYLSHVHRTKSMNVGVWIWGLCQRIKEKHDNFKPSSQMTDIKICEQWIKRAARKGMEKQVSDMKFHACAGGEDVNKEVMKQFVQVMDVRVPCAL